MAHDDSATDRPRNWIVAVCCCFINLTFYGVSRLSGIMLVATTHTFQVSRASAAMPFSLSTAVRNLAGVFVGQLGHRFGVGPVVATGCIIASLGAGLCFFAQDMEWLTVCWGGVFGFGFGLSTCLLPLAINQNFVKHNGTASGISYSGAYLGSFIFPPVVVWLLDTFGLQGTFLIISGSVLNVLIAAVLLREKKPNKKRAINQSSTDVSFNEPYSDQKTVSFICKEMETGDLWKQNINRAFLDSQGNLTDESYCKVNVSNANLPYLLPDPAYFKTSPEIENFARGNGVSHLPSQTHAHHNLLSNFFRNLKLRRMCSRNGELEKNSSVLQTTSPSSSFFFPPERNCDSFRASNVVHPSKNFYENTAGDVAKEIPAMHRLCFRKLLETRLLSKGKCKAKYKLKLQKLKKVLEISLFRNKTHSLKELIQTENVKLTSFGRLESYFSPICFYLSQPCSISNSQNAVEDTDQSTRHSNFDIVHQSIPVNRDIIHPPSLSKSASVSNFSSRDDENPQSFSANICVQDVNACENNIKSDSFSLRESSSAKEIYDNRSSKSTTCDDVSSICKTEDNINFTEPSSPAKDSYDDVSSKGSMYDDISSICKTEDSQSSYCVPSSSSDLFFQDSSTGNEDSYSGRSKSYKSVEKAARNCFADWIHMLREPMFTLIGSTMSVQTFIVVCVVTTIEDFAKDVGIEENRTYFALMALSISNLVGTLTLGSVTDRGYISRHRFLSLCFLGMSLSLVALSLFAVSLPSLLCVVVFYGLLESGVIITFPILMKQFVKGERRQAVAIASSNMLSAPTVMLVPMLIGHFRDNIGCYSGLFYVLGAVSFTCSLLWLVAPPLCEKRYLQKKKAIQRKISAVC